ncbi:hypothetical protein ABTB76_19200, partial [Acinetobacter baumannii]
NSHLLDWANAAPGFGFEGSDMYRDQSTKPNALPKYGHVKITASEPYRRTTNAARVEPIKTTQDSV